MATLGQPTSEQKAGEAKRRRGARPLADLIGASLSPACRKRGFTTAELISSWPDIVGDRYAQRVAPDRIVWQRGSRGRDAHGEALGQAMGEPAILEVHTDGATALMLSHETQVVVERINSFFGWAAIGRIKIVQRPIITRRRAAIPSLRKLTPEEEVELSSKVDAVANPALKQALERLGRAIIAKNR